MIPIEDTQYVREHIDGGGSIFKTHFVTEVKKEERIFEHAFEWCAGLGEIGMDIMRAGLTRRLTISDINAKAISLARSIAQRDELDDQMHFFSGDNLDPLPADFKFDLVVGNPPSYINMQTTHPIGSIFHQDIRLNDPDWKIHEKFFIGIGHFMTDNSVLFLHEIDPFHKEVYIHGKSTPYDVRSQVPMDVYEKMTKDNGLKITDAIPMPHDGDAKSYMLRIVRSA